MDDLLARFDSQLRRQPRWPGAQHADGVIRMVADDWGGILWSDFSAEDADAVIAREVEFFAERPGWEWKTYSYDRPADLPHRLRAAGFVPEDQETLLIARLADLPRTSPLPDGVELLPVVDATGIEAFLQVADAVFGHRSDRFGAQLLADIEADRTAALVAVADGRPISSGRIEFYDGTDFVGLYGGGTVAEWRHRGIFRAVVAYRVDLADKRGYSLVQTDASDDSRPIFLRMGFEAVATTTPYIHP